MELQAALEECRMSYEHLTQRAIDAQVERDRLIMQIESIRDGKPLDEIDTKYKDFELVKCYITRIQELEAELVRLQNSNHLSHEKSDNYHDSEDDGTHSRNSYLMDSDIKTVEEADGVVEDVEKELEHSSLQEQLDRELKELDKRLEQKEAEMKRFVTADPSVLKQHYEKKVHDLELEKRALQKEIEDLRHNLSNISSNTDDSAQKLKEEYLQKLNALETQVAQLKKKQDAQAQLLRQKQKSDEAAKRLQDEIHRIKTQKVQLQQKIKQESEQFRLWKASREKEVLQLKKEGRRNEYEMHKLLALNQRQKLVLQRKTEEAAMATKRLKELLDSRKVSRETSGAGSTRGPGIQALVRTIEHELEVTVGVHEVRSEYERQLKERAKMAEEVAKLKEETLIEKQQNLSKFPQTMSPGARNSRILALENMLATSSSALVSMASQLSEAEERERAFSGRGRWNQVRSLAEAKDIMNFLFNLASSSRCQLRNNEVECREKDLEIRELKEKVVNLGRQLELKNAELSRQENLTKLALERRPKEVKEGPHTRVASSSDFRPMASQISNSGLFETVDDMDTSDDVQSDPADNTDYDTEWVANDDETDTEWDRTKERKRRPARKRRNSAKTDKQVENVVDLEQSTSMRSDERVCCSCTKYSSCKTLRCECRAANGGCGFSCSCEPTKCSNREQVNGEETHDLASHGAMLLQTALSEKPATARKPLSDIGNMAAAKANNNARKKWRKSAIQLVPATPPVTTQGLEEPQPKKPVDEIPLKLPRAMRSTLTNNNQLKENNSDHPGDSDVSTSTNVHGKENKEI